MTEPGTQTNAVENAAGWVTTTIGQSGFHTEVQASGHALHVDEPVSLGGTARGPTPYDYLLTAMGSCMVMTLRLYADRKGWPLEAATVQLRSGRLHEKDCEDCEKQTVGIGLIDRRIELSGPLTDEQKARLLEIADRCPVKQTLERGIKVQNYEPQA